MSLYHKKRGAPTSVVTIPAARNEGPAERGLRGCDRAFAYTCDFARLCGSTPRGSFRSTVPTNSSPTPCAEDFDRERAGESASAVLFQLAPIDGHPIGKERQAVDGETGIGDVNEQWRPFPTLSWVPIRKVRLFFPTARDRQLA